MRGFSSQACRSFSIKDPTRRLRPAARSERNHIGFTVPNVQEAVAKWKAAGVPFEPGAPGRLDQGWVTTTDGLKIEIQEDKNQKEPIRSKHVHFFLPENAIAQSQAWYGKVFGAKAGVLNNAPVADSRRAAAL